MTKSIIDVHSHAIFPSWREALHKSGRSNAYAPDWSVDGVLRMMDQHGIARSVLSVPNVFTLMCDVGAPALARRINEEFAELIHRHPDRFGAFALLPQNDLDAMVDETIYALDHLRFDGINTSTHVNGIYLGDPALDAWFDQMDRRAAILFVHPGVSAGFVNSSLGLNPSILDFMFETTRALANLVFSGRKKRFGRMKIISTHGGGTIPYLAHRLELLEPVFGPGPERLMLSAEEVREGLASFYFDLTACMNPGPLRALRELVPVQQLLMGFDYPLMPETLVAPALQAFMSYEGFTEDERAAICRGNAERLFSL